MEPRFDIVGLLPVEMGEEIFGYLGAEDLAICCTVSKTWRKIANRNWIWKKFIEANWSNLDFIENNNESSLEPQCARAAQLRASRTVLDFNWRSNTQRRYLLNGVSVESWRLQKDLSFALGDKMGWVELYDLASGPPTHLRSLRAPHKEPIRSLAVSSLWLLAGQNTAIWFHRLSQGFGFSLALSLDRLSQEAFFSCKSVPEHCVPLQRISVVDEILYADFGSRLTLVTLGRVPEILGYWEEPGTLYFDCPGYVFALEKSYLNALNVSRIYRFHCSLQVLRVLSNFTYLAVLGVSSGGAYFLMAYSALTGERLWTRPVSRSFGADAHPRRPWVTLATDNGLVNYDMGANNRAEPLWIHDLGEKLAQAQISYLSTKLLGVLSRRDWAHYDSFHLICADSGIELYQLEISAVKILSVNPVSTIILSPEWKIEILTFFPQC